MPEEKGALEEFMAGLGKSNNPLESKDPFAPKEEEVKEENGSEKEEDSKPIAFHKDPRIIRFIEKEVSKRISATPKEELKPSQEGDEITSVLERVIGNDTPEKVQAVKDFRKALGSLEEKGAQRAIAQLQAQSQAERDEEKRAQNELDESFEEIEETYNVDLSSNTPQARKIRSEFVEYIRKIAPKNEDGEVSAYPDLSAAFETYQEMQKRPAPNRAKELASRSMSRSSDATVAPVQTKRDWKSIDKLFANLTS